MADEHDKDIRSEADLTYDRYDQQRELPPEYELPRDDFKDTGTYTKQSISREPEAEDVNFYVRSDMSPELGGRDSAPASTETSGVNADASPAVNERTEDEELPDVPDADDISANSPVDPSAMLEDMHGTDLINGYDGDDSEEL
ncbi:hypothetical protein [Paenibacillus sp. XY044]|uniref:hypothetical protein n=1 Tax=Paenibacillus sp. XY044 TaxID=2026089 RepID=UPI000B991F97|nr:hypothetical protein [Paenibacillus sp. XY044]OZB90802.1 hypothetical protein CJP46_30755 [Paenibacillus sp. XY044]